MSVWLVTGGSGFLGRHLLARLSVEEPGSGIEIIVAGRRCPDRWSSDRFVRLDLEEPSALARTLADVRPDLVFHLAGRTPPALVPEFYRANTGGTIAVLSALRKVGRSCRLVLAGSAAELGRVPEESLPVDESYPCQPDGPYAMSKWFASHHTLKARGRVEAIVARIFNPIGPGMPVGQAFGRFASILAREGRAPGPGPIRLRVGDLTPRRDFIDARDVADALVALALRGRPASVYHVGTGVSRSVGEGLFWLISRSGKRVEVVGPPTGAPLARPRDSRADIGRIVREVNWSPRIRFERSLADLWADVSADQRAPAEPKAIRESEGDRRSDGAQSSAVRGINCRGAVVEESSDHRC